MEKNYAFQALAMAFGYGHGKYKAAFKILRKFH
jgi:hypothetical protein